jgi:hypothetical protein
VVLGFPVAALGHLEGRERLAQVREARRDQPDLGRRCSHQEPFDHATVQADDIQDRHLVPERLATESVRGFEMDLVADVNVSLERRLVVGPEITPLSFHNAEVIVALHACKGNRPCNKCTKPVTARSSRLVSVADAG